MKFIFLFLHIKRRFVKQEQKINSFSKIIIDLRKKMSELKQKIYFEIKEQIIERNKITKIKDNPKKIN